MWYHGFNIALEDPFKLHIIGLEEVDLKDRVMSFRFWKILSIDCECSLQMQGFCSLKVTFCFGMASTGIHGALSTVKHLVIYCVWTVLIWSGICHAWMWSFPNHWLWLSASILNCHLHSANDVQTWFVNFTLVNYWLAFQGMAKFVESNIKICLLICGK